MRDDQSVVALVAKAAGSDQDAWDELVERYAPMVWSICSRYRLSRPDIEDVGQNVWLRLVEQIGNLREPAALPGWLSTTTQRECLRVLHRRDRLVPLPEELPPGTDDAMIEQGIMEAERNAALRAALAELPPHCRQLLSMLISDPPHPYAQISTLLQIRIGSIGPQRARCLERLRRSRHLATVIGGEAAATLEKTAGGEPRA
ncbi:MAG: RNA polymerase sigma factor [Streptosporangiales bacterium]